MLSRLLTAASSGAARRFSSSGLHGAAVGCAMGPTYAHALTRADATYQSYQFVCLNRVEYVKDVDGQVCAVRVQIISKKGPYTWKRKVVSFYGAGGGGGGRGRDINSYAVLRAAFRVPFKYFCDFTL